jgi:secondary thiamine-phosphate synthase enzyme
MAGSFVVTYPHHSGVKQMKFEVQVSSKQRAEFVDITSEVQSCVRKSGVQNGVCVLSVPHTTAGLAVNENWDPSVKVDILAVLDRLVPWQANYRHTEGNAAAHIKSCLVGTSEMLLVEAGQLALGTWQGIFFAEFDGPRRRRVFVRVIPDVEGV